MTPPGLRILTTLTGINHGADLPAAYTAALALAEQPPDGRNDCDPTYKAIAALMETMTPGADQTETALTRALDRDDAEQLGRVILHRTDASFLLGFAYAYVLVTAINQGAR